MVISIDFCGPQRVVTRTESINMPISERTRVTDAFEYVRHHYPDLPLDEEMVLVTVNQKTASRDRVLRANDSVSFIPPHRRRIVTSCSNASKTTSQSARVIP